VIAAHAQVHEEASASIENNTLARTSNLRPWMTILTVGAALAAALAVTVTVTRLGRSSGAASNAMDGFRRGSPVHCVAPSWVARCCCPTRTPPPQCNTACNARGPARTQNPSRFSLPGTGAIRRGAAAPIARRLMDVKQAAIVVM
jgi:hypothetical protein